MTVVCISCDQAFADAFAAARHECPKVCGPRLIYQDIDRALCVCQHLRSLHTAEGCSCVGCRCLKGP